MKTLEQFIAFYCAQHRIRIDKDIAKERYEDNKDRLAQQKEEYTTGNHHLVARLSSYYNSLTTKQPADLCRYRCLDINKTIWKTVSYALGIPTFKTQKQLHEWMRSYYGPAFTAWREEVAEQKKQKQAEEEQQRILDEQERKEWRNKRIVADAHELKFADGKSIHQFTEKYYAEGYRLTQVRHGFGYRNRIAQPTIGDYVIIKQPRRKDHRHRHFTDTIYAYFALYQCQQTSKKPTLTERFPLKLKSA